MSDNIIDYEKLAEAIAKKLQAAAPPEKVLWDSKEAAKYLIISERHFMDCVCKTYGFPSPVQIPSSNGTKGRPRWYAIEVQAWVQQFKRAS
jgi:predicted DNA-binding transcriptional regulator AlpA